MSIRGVLVGLAAAFGLVLVGALSASGQPGHARNTIHVRHGPNAITKALKRADPGDKLRLPPGRYRESVAVTKPVTIVGSKTARRPVIDGECRADVTIAVSAPGVVLEHLKVIGATHLASAGREVDFSNVGSGKIRDVRVSDTCDAEYGINLLATGGVRVSRSSATGFSDAGIYVGNVVDTLTRTLRVLDNESFGNNKGIVVELSAGGDILVEGNNIHDNTLPGIGEQVGILINVSDGVRMLRNTVTNDGDFGIQLTPDSDGNILGSNTVTGNPIDILDQGSGNCGVGNITSTPTALPPC